MAGGGAAADVDGAGGAAGWVSFGVGAGVGDLEGLGEVELLAADAALCVAAGLGVGVEVATLLHPAASVAASARATNLREVTNDEISVTPFYRARARGPGVMTRNSLSRTGRAPVTPTATAATVPRLKRTLALLITDRT